MSIRIYTDNEIEIDGLKTGLKVTQTGKGTVVYTPEQSSMGQINRVIRQQIGRDDKGMMRYEDRVVQVNHSGTKYKEHQMPHARYSLSHDKPASGVAGKVQFETDIRELMERLQS